MEISKRKLVLSNFEAIKQQASSIRKKLADIDNLRISASGRFNEMHLNSIASGLSSTSISETKALLESYGNSKSNAEKLLAIKLLSIEYKNPPEAVLRKLLVECEKVIGFSKSMETKLTHDDIDRLNHIRKELTKVCDELEIDFEKNLEKAVMEAEQGHSLASSLITSRVIQVILDNFKKQSGESDINKVIEFLISKQLIDKDELESKDFIIKVSKRSRNFFSHRLTSYAQPSDALSLLGDVGKLLNIYKKLNSQ